MKKLKKVFATCSCAALLLVATTPASAASYKLVYYTLYNKKTNQPVKGYAVYKNTLYYDAIEKVGRYSYKGVLYHGAPYSGVQRPDGIRYVDGKPLTGFHNESGKYFVKGIVASGTYDGILYKNGRAFSGVVDAIRYVDGVRLTGIHKDSGKYFVDGVVANGMYNGTVYKNGYAH